MMKKVNGVFVDTSGWAEFLVQTTPYHLEAKRFLQQWHTQGTRVVTTNYVLVELVSLLTSPLKVPRIQQIHIIEMLQAATWVEIIHIDVTLHQQAWQLLTQRSDKNWSLTDCSSFIIMHHHHLTEALTTDHHFEQAGFIRLLK
jgi:predicted nucleic acid-binding protein